MRSASASKYASSWHADFSAHLSHHENGVPQEERCRKTIKEIERREELARREEAKAAEIARIRGQQQRAAQEQQAHAVLTATRAAKGSNHVDGAKGTAHFIHRRAPLLDARSGSLGTVSTGGKARQASSAAPAVVRAAYTIPYCAR